MAVIARGSVLRVYRTTSDSFDACHPLDILQISGLVADGVEWQAVPLNASFFV